MKKFTLAALAVCVLGQTANAALNAGDLMFTGFNADGDDGFAIVALADITAGEAVYIRDDEWGPGWGTGEGEMLWTLPNVAAGTVFFFDDVDGPSPGITATGGAAVGTLADTPFDGASSGPGDFGISSSGEGIFLFQGASNTPSTFITAFDSGEFIEDVTPAGLTVGLTAIALTGVTGDPDVAEYTGPRSGLTSYAAYLPFLADPANWTVLGDGSGDQSLGNLPFNTTAFTIVPEPTSLALAAFGMIGLMIRRK